MEYDFDAEGDTAAFINNENALWFFARAVRDALIGGCLADLPNARALSSELHDLVNRIEERSYTLVMQGWQWKNQHEEEVSWEDEVESYEEAA